MWSLLFFSYSLYSVHFLCYCDCVNLDGVSYMSVEANGPDKHSLQFRIRHGALCRWVGLLAYTLLRTYTVRMLMPSQRAISPCLRSRSPLFTEYIAPNLRYGVRSRWSGCTQIGGIDLGSYCIWSTRTVPIYYPYYYWTMPERRHDDLTLYGAAVRHPIITTCTEYGVDGKESNLSSCGGCQTLCLISQGLAIICGLALIQ